MNGSNRHVAHFNWATLLDDVGSPGVAGFVDAIGRVNALAERSDGFIWRSGDENVAAQAINWPLFDDPRTIASFSVWETPEALRSFVYRTVHGAFYRRKAEWFVPGSGVNYVLWWVPVGTVPGFEDARRRVETIAQHGPTEHAFDFTWLDARMPV